MKNKFSAVQLNNKHFKLCVWERYKVLTRNFRIFLHNFDSIMNYLHTSKIEFVIWGDTNINLPKIMVNEISVPLTSFTLTYCGLPHKNPKSPQLPLIIHSFRLEHMSTELVLNGLSDHNVQLLVIKNKT